MKNTIPQYQLVCIFCRKVKVSGLYICTRWLIHKVKNQPIFFISLENKKPIKVSTHFAMKQVKEKYEADIEVGVLKKGMNYTMAKYYKDSIVNCC